MKFDTEIQQRLKSYNRGYEGFKQSPQDWADMLEEDPYFADKFKRVFNNSGIIEADGFTPEFFEDMYVDMDIALPRYG